MADVAAINAPAIKPRRSMSSRAAVSSEITMAKKMTVAAMYHDVAIQLATSGLSMMGTALME